MDNNEVVQAPQVEASHAVAPVKPQSLPERFKNWLGKVQDSIKENYGNKSPLPQGSLPDPFGR